MRVSSSDTSSISTPSETIDRSWLLLDLLVNSRCFSVVIDVPYINISIHITTCKDSWMGWTPLCVIHVLLRTFECEERLEGSVGTPDLDSPIHGAREEKLIHVAVPLTH